MVHKVLHIGFVLIAIGVFGALVKYSVFENYAAMSHNTGALDAAAALAIPTTNAESVKGTNVSKGKEVFQATISTSTDATPAAIFTIASDEKSIVYYLTMEVDSSSARLFCITGPTSRFPIVNLNSAGTITGSDLLPYADSCDPSINSMADLLKAIRMNKIELIIDKDSGYLKAQ